MCLSINLSGDCLISKIKSMFYPTTFTNFDQFSRESHRQSRQSICFLNHVCAFIITHDMFSLDS